jgi:hypothetical protein
MMMLAVGASRLADVCCLLLCCRCMVTFAGKPHPQHQRQEGPQAIQILTAGGSACSSSMAWIPANSPTDQAARDTRRAAAEGSRGRGAEAAVSCRGEDVSGRLCALYSRIR